MRLRSLSVLAVMAMVVVSCGGGVPEASGPSEGIQVHGEWTIDIYNEDGSLDRSVEFSNALTIFGARQLAQLVSGNASVGQWSIHLSDLFAGPDLCPSSDFGSGCRIPAISGVWTTGSPMFSLNGSTVVESDGQIATVATRLGRCEPDISPNSCNADGTSFPFTEKDLDVADRVDVTAGQTVQVEVEISFTSG